MLKTSLRLLLMLAVQVLAVQILAGCAPRPGPELLWDTAAPVPDARTVTVYVATTRQGEADEPGIFTSGRATRMSYARYVISIPPDHQPGRIEWPHGKVNPQTDFATVSRQALDRAAFQSQVSRRHGQPPEVGVFVHGYNTNFQEALYQLAQMTADAGVDGVPILFAWPSDGNVSSYIADKDAVTASRDQLVDLLVMLAGKPTRGPITVIGHSMGGWLTVEATRQLRLTGQDKVIDRLHVVLAAPDIDVDVFQAQMAVIGPLSPPMTILVSRDDVALSVSEKLASDRQRIGRLDVSDPRVEEAARKARVQVVDISGLDTFDQVRHSRFMALAALYPKLSADGSSGTGGGVRRTGAFVLTTVGTTLSSPFTLAGQIVGGR